MSVSANDLRERFNGLFGTVYTENKIIELSEDVENLRMLVGDIVIWIEQQDTPPLLPRAERRENVAAYAKQLKERGFSLRESAQIIGVSHEQIRLLLKTGAGVSANSIVARGSARRSVEYSNLMPTTREIVRVFNQFTKGAEPNPCQLYSRQFKAMTAAEKQRTAENILAGDPVDVAIKDAKEFCKSGTENN